MTSENTQDGGEQGLLGDWLRLRHTWPGDGWVGAATARATHHEKVMAVEQQLRAEHEHSGHGPIEDFGVNQRRCICGATPSAGMQVNDPRILDRYGKFVA